MDLTDLLKRYIDSLSYEYLLSVWRFGPAGIEILQGETGKYWAKRMAELRNKGVNTVAASKQIGWDYGEPGICANCGLEGQVAPYALGGHLVCKACLTLGIYEKIEQVAGKLRAQGAPFSPEAFWEQIRKEESKRN